MDWGTVIWIILGVVGAGLILGGIVAYREATKSGIRAFAAGLISSGFAMWVVIGFTIPASTSSSGGDSPGPVVALGVASAGAVAPPALGREEVSALLTADDINLVAGGGGTLIVEYRDGRAMAASVDASQIVEVESWFISGFQSTNPIRGLTFSVMDFRSTRAAKDHFDKVISETPGLIFMDPPIGDISANVVFNGSGLGSIIMYRLGDRFVSLHTAQVGGVEPLMPLAGLEELAHLVESRIPQSTEIP